MSRKVHTAWDLGVNDATSVWMYQQIGHAIHLVDYLEARNEGLPYYVSELAKKKYLWGRHFAPHDIEVRELGSGKSRREIAYELGLDFITLPKLPLEDGIHNAQVSLSRCYFDYDNCKRGIEALRQYHRSYNDKTRVFAASPKRTWATHGADAFRYLCMSLRDHDDFRKPMAPFADNKYNPLGNEVFA
jgi:phage terminase large subunit